MPLRPHKRIAKTSMELPQPETEDSRHRQWMDEKFLPFDYTRNNLEDQQHHHDTTRSTTQSSIPSPAPDLMINPTPMTTSAIDGNASMGGNGKGITGTRLLRRVGSALDHYEQAKYKAQGYALTPNDDEMLPASDRAGKHV